MRLNFNFSSQNLQFAKDTGVWFCCVTLILGLVSGCSGKKIDESDPAALYQDAEDEIKDDHYQIAIDKLRVVKNKFPYSKFSVQAHLRIADVLFLQSSYTEAAVQYESFRDLHPKHEKVPYATFRIGKSYFNEIPSPLARDLTPAQKSLEAYTDLLRRFPDVQEAKEAKTDVTQVRKLLAQKELYIANFYFKRDYYDSARPRYKKIVEQFPETESAQEAEEKLKKIERELKSGKSATPDK